MNMKVKLLENHVQSQSSEFLIVLAFGIVFDIRYQPSIWMTTMHNQSYNLSQLTSW